MNFSFLPLYAFLLSIVVGFDSLFDFLRIFWKDIKSEFKELKLELKSEIQEVCSEAKTESQGLRTETVQLQSDIHGLHSELKFNIQRVDKNVFYLRERMDVLVDSFALRFLSTASFGRTSPKQV
ncbi:DUF1640 domain-containing protein [Leptospira mayottensis]|uniref:DUF1640 domain-containing protein n=1 Tax=Leptospira mayottensis TaxID=1137606 RepID=UPI000E35E290|nr:DUF1640 domain-containing protein [Leptospira mayottensis]AXR69875.1 DUF1640 domain-containing protein [Leptospira mayottensis]